MHLFFTCPFVKAAWFLEPWFIRTDLLIQGCISLAQVIMNLSNMNHPHASLSNILTFMWCAWKSRNDMLFNRKMGEPYQISINARALTTNQDFVHDVNLTLQANTNSHLVQAPGCNLQGATIDTDSAISGCVLFVDASWGCRSVPAVDGAQYTGLGVLIRNEQYEIGRAHV